MYKKTLSFIFLTLILATYSVNAGTADKNKPEGKWKFNVVGAPYGYEQGIIEISKEKQEYTGTMSFTGYDYKFTLESLSYEKEQLGFNLYVEGEDVLIVLKFEEEDKLSGKVAYSQGELGISAERIKE